MENDRSYFMRRAAQERSAADRAADGAARDVHLEMARRYRDLVGGLPSAQSSDVASTQSRLEAG